MKNVVMKVLKIERIYEDNKSALGGLIGLVFRVSLKKKTCPEKNY